MSASEADLVRSDRAAAVRPTAWALGGEAAQQAHPSPEALRIGCAQWSEICTSYLMFIPLKTHVKVVSSVTRPRTALDGAEPVADHGPRDASNWSDVGSERLRVEAARHGYQRHDHDGKNHQQQH